MIANSSVFYPTDGHGGSIACFLQGFVQNYFYLCSFFWTITLAYNIHALAVHGKLQIYIKVFHCINWGVPLVLSLLPLTTEMYKESSDDDDWCWLQARYQTADSSQVTLFWTFFAFWIPLLLCAGTSIYWESVMMSAVTYRNNEHANTCIKRVVNTLVCYPIIIIGCWLPNLVQIVFWPNYKADMRFVVAVNSISIAQGGLVAILFMVSSCELRYNWIELFKSVCIKPFCYDSWQENDTLSARLTSSSVARASTMSRPDSSVDGYRDRDVLSYLLDKENSQYDFGHDNLYYSDFLNDPAFTPEMIFTVKDSASSTEPSNSLMWTMQQSKNSLSGSSLGTQSFWWTSSFSIVNPLLTGKGTEDKVEDRNLVEMA